MKRIYELRRVKQSVKNAKRIIPQHNHSIRKRHRHFSRKILEQTQHQLNLTLTRRSDASYAVTVTTARFRSASKGKFVFLFDSPAYMAIHFLSHRHRFIRHPAYNVRYSAVPINSSLLNHNIILQNI